MSQRRAPEPYVQWKVSVPATTAARVELVFLNPVLQKAEYGSRSHLITTLLNDWLEKYEQSNGKIIPPSLTPAQL